MTRNHRLVIVCGVVGLLVVCARLIEHHYYYLSWAACARGSTLDFCNVWRLQALVEALIVIGSTVAAWIYFGKRDAPKG